MKETAKLVAGESVFVPSSGVRMHMKNLEPPPPQGITITNLGDEPLTVGTMYL